MFFKNRLYTTLGHHKRRICYWRGRRHKNSTVLKHMFWYALKPKIIITCSTSRRNILPWPTVVIQMLPRITLGIERSVGVFVRWRTEKAGRWSENRSRKLEIDSKMLENRSMQRPDREMAPRMALGRLWLDCSGNQEHFLKRKWSQNQCCWDPLRDPKGTQIQENRIREHRKIIARKVSENDAQIIVKWYQNHSTIITNMMLFAKTWFCGNDLFTHVKACFLNFRGCQNHSISNH